VQGERCKIGSDARRQDDHQREVTIATVLLSRGLHTSCNPRGEGGARGWIPDRLGEARTSDASARATFSRAGAEHPSRHDPFPGRSCSGRVRDFTR
jgi:hypothetical protein